MFFFFFRPSAAGEERTESGHRKKTGESLQHAIKVAMRRLRTLCVCFGGGRGAS